eukprot:1156219-Pelagomonas_calceolata.AAC.3
MPRQVCHTTCELLPSFMHSLCISSSAHLVDLAELADDIQPDVRVCVFQERQKHWNQVLNSSLHNHNTNKQNVLWHQKGGTLKRLTVYSSIVL